MYNYEHTPDNDPIVRLITGILKKNRKIMLDLNPDGIIKVSRQQLTDKGFDFNYYTNIYETEKMDKYFYCYEMGYLSISEKLILLVKRDNYNKTPSATQRSYKQETNSNVLHEPDQEYQTGHHTNENT
jgi:hypothetical protein